ncbi:hypothetical protein CJ232_02870 [Hoylesella timonensis]|uniref:Uncharacterized protein n=2 Tax=Hoylesella timonensis TaxID=386414 RepID=A0A2N6Q7Y6_9BACT|nr:hypothetical protein CJ232_02870 [Hoylesella timonensis]
MFFDHKVNTEFYNIINRNYMKISDKKMYVSPNCHVYILDDSNELMAASPEIKPTTKTEEWVEDDDKKLDNTDPFIWTDQTDPWD